jgi:CheY-like chemotaxis protein
VGPRCLIVDDNLQFQTAARDLLEREGVSVVGVASTIAEALERVEALRPDVTLVDVDLGDDSGFELARRLAAAPHTGRVVLISTHAEEDFSELIEASPAVGFLSKADLSREAICGLLASEPRDT